jgi:radical SAM superfamily enzyme with C-terminal helix-hairpin-helix motif
LFSCFVILYMCNLGVLKMYIQEKWLQLNVGQFFLFLYILHIYLICRIHIPKLNVFKAKANWNKKKKKKKKNRKLVFIYSN